MIRSILDRRPVLWLILALPALGMLASLGTSGLSPHAALHPTGETAMRLTILAMMISPLRVIFPHSGVLYWFVRRRRDIGVAAFAYAGAHTVLYLLDKGALAPVLSDLPRMAIWTGWLSMALFIVLGLTSNNASVRALGASWKTVQRLTYPAALLAVVHWALVAHGLGGLLVHVAPLALLEAWRIGAWLRTGRLSAA